MLLSSAGAAGSRCEVSLWIRPMQSLGEGIMAVIQPVFLRHPKFPRGLLWGRRALSPCDLGSVPLHRELCFVTQDGQRQQAVLFQRSRCIVHGWAIPGARPCASTLCCGRTALHRIGANFTPAPEVPCRSSSPCWHWGRSRRCGVVWGGRRRGLRLGGGSLAPVYHPRVCVQVVMLWPCRAVAMEIACAVARQLKHLRLHTAMPRNSQLSSFLSPAFDFADMTPLALILLHSVALLRLLGVNPINPIKPAWHCK